MSKKRDILFLCQYFYPEYVSSATLPWDTAEKLADYGYKVSALCGYPKEYNNEKNIPMHEIHNNVEITRIKYIETGRNKKIGRLINQFTFMLSCATKIFKFHNYKAIVVYSNPPVLPLIPVLSKKLWKTKIVFVSYDVYPEIAQVTNVADENGIMSKIMRMINNSLFKNVDKVVALSKEMKEFIASKRNVDKKIIDVIPNWYEVLPQTKEVSCSIPELANFKNEGNFIVSYFGNMGICNDMETIIDVVFKNKNPKVKFIFAGHGNKMQQIKEKCGRNDNVYISEFLHGDDFRYAQEISDCFIISLEPGLEGLCVPSKTYCYMAQGKPIIAIISKNTDIAKDIITENIGTVAENGDAHSIIEFVEKICEDNELQQAMSQKCKKVFMQKYTKEICTAKYCECMDSILKCTWRQYSENSCK